MPTASPMRRTEAGRWGWWAQPEVARPVAAYFLRLRLIPRRSENAHRARTAIGNNHDAATPTAARTAVAAQGDHQLRGNLPVADK
jgi:hypothetical protein